MILNETISYSLRFSSLCGIPSRRMASLMSKICRLSALSTSETSFCSTYNLICIFQRFKIIYGKLFPVVMSDPCQGGYLLATLMHNWHRPLYTQRGGKGMIKEPYLSPKKTCFMVFTMFPPLPQDWASQQATQTRSLLGHLHYLARKAATSR